MYSIHVQFISSVFINFDKLVGEKMLLISTQARAYDMNFGGINFTGHLLLPPKEFTSISVRIHICVRAHVLFTFLVYSFQIITVLSLLLLLLRNSVSFEFSFIIFFVFWLNQCQQCIQLSTRVISNGQASTFVRVRLEAYNSE